MRKAIEAGRLSSIILWGPPGSGKTTLARIVAQTHHAHFVQLAPSRPASPICARRSRPRRDRLGMTGQRTVLFIDEIHRFNKAQQDAICRTSRTARSP